MYLHVASTIVQSFAKHLIVVWVSAYTITVVNNHVDLTMVGIVVTFVHLLKMNAYFLVITGHQSINNYDTHLYHVLITDIYRLYYAKKLVMADFVSFFNRKQAKDLIHSHFNIIDRARQVRQYGLTSSNLYSEALFANEWA